jgi:hypothetical protein
MLRRLDAFFGRFDHFRPGWEICGKVRYFRSGPGAGENLVAACGVFNAPYANGGLYSHDQTRAGLCKQFAGSLHGDVIDKTGLAGTFGLHLDLSFDDRAHGEDGAPADPAAPAIPVD